MDISVSEINNLLYYIKYIYILNNIELDKRFEELKNSIYKQLDFNELEETKYFYNKYKS